jgi:stage V sporulation protein AD
MKQGRSTWVFSSKPCIVSTGVAGGPFEGQGPLGSDFDVLHSDIWLGQDSFEKAEEKLLEEACQIAISKAGIKKEDVEFFLSGDLMDQIISSSFAARTLAVPFLGIYGACSSAMEGLALASLLIESGAAENALAGTSSHNSASEKQYRYPTEYGAQKPPTAQWTATAAGAAFVSRNGQGPRVTCATIGKVVDMGISDPFNMGAAMAPAAVDTIMAHFRDTGRDPSYYDLIATGDLARVGHKIASDLLKDQKANIPDKIFTDCGILLYDSSQQVFAGGSGCGCSAAVTYGHLLNRMRSGKLSKILIVATGALLSPMSYQQKETIPCVAHAVSIEM